MAANPVILPVVLAIMSAVVGHHKWHDLPNPLPIWWDIQGEPMYVHHVTINRWFAVSILPALMVIIPYIVYLFASHDAAIKHQSGEQQHATTHLISLPALFLFVVHNFVLLDTYTSVTMSFPSRFFVATIALWLMIWAGYNLQYITPNHTVGILTPWTLRNDTVWEKTHSHAGWTLQLLGWALLVCALFVPTGLPLLIVTLVLFVGSNLYLVLYSWTISCITRDRSSQDRSSQDPLLESQA